GGDADVPVVEMDDAGVLACRQAQLVCAVGILEIQCAIDVLDDRLGSSQKISSVVLELEQRFAGKRSEFACRGGQDFVGGDAVHSAPPALTRSEVLLRRLSAS